MQLTHTKVNEATSRDTCTIVNEKNGHDPSSGSGSGGEGKRSTRLGRFCRGGGGGKAAVAAVAAAAAGRGKKKSGKMF